MRKPLEPFVPQNGVFIVENFFVTFPQHRKYTKLVEEDMQFELPDKFDREHSFGNTRASMTRQLLQDFISFLPVPKDVKLSTGFEASYAVQDISVAYHECSRYVFQTRKSSELRELYDIIERYFETYHKILVYAGQKYPNLALKVRKAIFEATHQNI